MFEVNDRIRIVNGLNKAFNGCEGTIISIVGIFHTIRFDDEFITDERKNFMRAAFAIYGEYLYVTLEHEMEIISNVDSGDLLPIGSNVVIVNYNHNVNGLTGTVKKYNDSDDLPYYVVINPGQESRYTDQLLTVKSLSDMIFGEFVMMLRPHEVQAVDMPATDGGVVNDETSPIAVGENVVIHGFDDDENTGFDGLTGYVTEVVDPVPDLIPEILYQVRLHDGQDLNNEVSTALRFNVLLLGQEVLLFTRNELKKVA